MCFLAIFIILKYSVTNFHNNAHIYTRVRALTSALEDERNKLQTDLAAVRSELKRKTSDRISGTGRGLLGNLGEGEKQSEGGEDQDSDSTVSVVRRK